jgi:flavin-binding protein dodecin
MNFWIGLGVFVWIGLVLLGLSVSAAADESIRRARRSRPLVSVANVIERDRSLEGAE